MVNPTIFYSKSRNSLSYVCTCDMLCSFAGSSAVAAIFFWSSLSDIQNCQENECTGFGKLLCLDLEL